MLISKIEKRAYFSNFLSLYPTKSYYLKELLPTCNNISEQNTPDKPVLIR